MADARKVYESPVVQKPSLEKVQAIATALGLDITQGDLKQYKDIIDVGVSQYNVLLHYPEDTLPVKYPRTPGYRPTAEENTHNAWYYKTNINGATSGKLQGKTLAIKDNIAVSGVPMMNGSKIVEGFTPAYDATVVTRVLDAGGSIRGKAVCEDLCTGLSSFTCSSGPVFNPHDKTRSAGGSSSGSAVLVSLGEVDMAIGGDQGGSIRFPACRCGIVGLKPTYGLVPYTGIINANVTMDHVGPMAGTVMDCALLLEVLAGYDNGLDPRQGRGVPDLGEVSFCDKLTGDISGLKIGLLKEGFAGCESDVEAIVRDAASKLKLAGAAVVEEVSIPMHTDGEAIWASMSHAGAYCTTITDAGEPICKSGFHATSMRDHVYSKLKANMNDLSTPVKISSVLAEYIRDVYGNRFYGVGTNVCRLLTRAYDEALKVYDVIAMPTIKCKTPMLPREDSDIHEIAKHAAQNRSNTCVANATGHPALSVNAGFLEGLPVGMMLVGRHFDDVTILRAAHALEKVLEDGK